MKTLSDYLKYWETVSSDEKCLHQLALVSLLNIPKMMTKITAFRLIKAILKYSDSCKVPSALDQPFSFTQSFNEFKFVIRFLCFGIEIIIIQSINFHGAIWEGRWIRKQKSNAVFDQHLAMVGDIPKI